MGFSSKTWGIAFLALGVACIVSTVVFRAYAVQTTVTAERNARLEHALAFSLWRYGVIESVNTADASFIVSISQDFSATAGDRRIRVYTTNDTRIGKQNLVEEDGDYVGLTPIEQGSFSSLSPGVRVALVIENQTEQNRLTARVILFGNPL